jgi:PIN domain
MMTHDALLFIDANKYLDLYRTETGHSILAALSEQTDHIFVTRKVVDEVKRHKINTAALFLKKHFKSVPKAETYKVPDHLFGVTETQSNAIRSQMKEIGQKIEQVNKELSTLAANIMKKISQSADEVSTALAPIFAKAVCPSDENLRKATERKLRGDPPGKANNPFGDQVNWEQILSRFVGKKKLWIITTDSDYGTMYNDEGFLNQFLYEELQKVSPGAEAFYFANIPSAIAHFADVTGVKADRLPTREQRKEIKEEEESLPPLDWLRFGPTGPTGAGPSISSGFGPTGPTGAGHP